MSNEAIDMVKDVPNNDEWQLVTGSHERDHVLTHIDTEVDKWSHGSLFVKNGNGEYTDVLFFAGNVPYLNKSVTRIL